MDIKSKKKKIFDKIAALRLLAGDSSLSKSLGLDNFNLKNGLPKLKISASFPSINNGTNPIQFLLDLVKSLVGFDVLLESLTSTLSYSTPDIVDEILKLLKTELKSIVSCGVDPSIPDFLKTTGIIIEVSKIDYLDLFKLDPNSTAGKLLYQDITPILTDSSDLNTFLYGVIQNDGTTYTWKNMLEFTFNSNGIPNVRPNNSFTIKMSSGYSTKTLTDLNNDFISHLSTPNSQLIDAKKLVNDTVDNVYGTVSSFAKKTLKQLELQAKIDNVIQSLIDSDSSDVVDDSYFTFSNDEIYAQQEKAKLKQNGIVKLECCNKVSATIPITQLTNFNDEIDSATLVEEKKNVISKHLNIMATQTTANSKDTSDNQTIKLNFIEEIIKNLTKGIVGNILSPKLISIFLINYKIIYGESTTFMDPIDFLKKNKNLINAIVKKISGIIISILVNIALKKVATLVADSQAKKEIEKQKDRLNQLTSLTSINFDVFKQIKVGVNIG